MARGSAGRGFYWLTLFAVSLAVVHASSSLQSVLPGVDFLRKVFSTEVDQEITTTALLQQFSTFEVQSEEAKSFMVCSGTGRTGVIQTSKALGEAPHYPLFSDDTTTCHIVVTQASKVDEMISSGKPVKYALAIPSILKLAKGFYDAVSGGSYMSAGVDTPYSYETGIRATLIPDIDAVAVLNKIGADLAGEGYKERILEDFLWAKKYSPLSNESKSTVKVSLRGEQWNQQLHSALTPGGPVCDYSALSVDITGSRLTVQKVCSVHKGDEAQASSCVLALIAYLSSHNSVLFVEPSHKLQLLNYLAAPIVQSKTTTNTSIWNKGLQGEDQIVALIDSGVDRNQLSNLYLYEHTTSIVLSTRYGTLCITLYIYIFRYRYIIYLSLYIYIDVSITILFHLS